MKGRAAGKRREAARVEIARIFTASQNLERLPEWRDSDRLMEHVIGVMVRLTGHENPHVAFDANEWLAGYSKGLREQAQNGKAVGVIEELRALYRKALPERQEPLVEAELDAEGQPERAKRS